MRTLRLAAIAGHGAPAVARAAVDELVAVDGEAGLTALPIRWLAPLVDRVDELSPHGEGSALSTTVMEAARIASLTVWAANQVVIDRARALGDALAAAGVRAVALKGIGLIDCHRSVAHRPLGDLDVLVAPHDLERASAVLRAEGWLPAHPIEPYLLRQRHAVIATSVVNDGVVVDLHWRASGWLPLGRGGDVDSQPWPLARACAAPVGHPLHASGLLVLTPVDNLAVVAAHGCRPGNEHAVHLAADAHRIVTAHPTIDGAVVLASLAEVGHRHRGARWLQQVAADYGTELPVALRTSSGAGVGERIAARLERFAASASRRGGSARWRLAAGVLAGSLAVAWWRPWRLPRQLVERVRWERSSARSAAKAAAGLSDDGGER